MNARNVSLREHHLAPRLPPPRKLPPSPAPTPAQRAPLPKPLAARTDRGLARGLRRGRHHYDPRWRRIGLPPSRVEQARAAVDRREVQLAARAFITCRRTARASARTAAPTTITTSNSVKHALYKEFGKRHAAHRLEQVAYDAGWSADDAARFARLS